MRILQEDTAGVVIDIQERLLPHIHDHNNLLENCLRLIGGLQILSVPMIVTQQYTRGLGPTDRSVAGKFAGFSHIEKTAFSCCDEPAFIDEVARTGKKNIIICGIESHVCVLQTCLDLIACSYNPVVVEDCVSSRNPGDKVTAIGRMRQEGARITTYESILFELTRYSGTETFKKISQLVK
ncbi:MAG: hydrolase [Marinilabiliales bacterium]|nr:MAG: hydrolase [Marinilabiliales bacterium]